MILFAFINHSNILKSSVVSTEAFDLVQILFQFAQNNALLYSFRIIIYCFHFKAFVHFKMTSVNETVIKTLRKLGV